MVSTRLSALALAAFSLLALVAAHEDMDMDMGMDMGHSAPSNVTETISDTYFRHGTAAWLLYSHIALLTLAWVFVLPAGRLTSLPYFSLMSSAVFLSIAKSRYQLSVETVFSIINAVGMFFATIYKTQVPDLYPGNVHYKLGWVLAILVGIHSLLLLLKKFGLQPTHTYESMAFLPMTDMTTDNLEMHNKIDPHRFSDDSGQGSDRATSAPQSPEYGPTSSEHFDDLEEVQDDEKPFNPESRLDRFISSKIPKIKSPFVTKLVENLYFVLDRSRIPLGSIAICTGIITMSGIMMGNHVFNGLAHFIKGGIFFAYGILTLGRWLGCFAELGWAWNVNPQLHPRVPSAEFVESFVIFLYGCVNVWLEHLAAWGQAWHPEDLEHVAISLMFFGGGLVRYSR
jgi:hypothetical protein